MMEAKVTTVGCTSAQAFRNQRLLELPILLREAIGMEMISESQALALAGVKGEEQLIVEIERIFAAQHAPIPPGSCDASDGRRPEATSGTFTATLARTISERVIGEMKQLLPRIVQGNGGGSQRIDPREIAAEVARRIQGNEGEKPEETKRQPDRLPITDIQSIVDAIIHNQ